MKALIYCAGLGTRLRPLTYEVPKPMIEVGGKPVLERVIEHLGGLGITEIIVNLHHLPNQIYEHFGTKLLYFYEPELLDEVGTLFALRKWLANDDFVLMMGDTVTNLDLQKMYEYHLENKSKMTTFVDKNGVCGGTWIGDSNFPWHLCVKARKLEDIPSLKFYSEDYWWIDMGTPAGLEKAREKCGRLEDDGKR